MSENINDNEKVTITRGELREFVHGVISDYEEQKAKNARPTKSEIMSVKNPTERQKLIRENLDLFRK